MISKQSRKSTGSVEQLKQGSFTAAKGVDEKASILDSEHVLFTKNLVTDSDGGLILRKPIKNLSNIPDIVYDSEIMESTVRAVQYLFDGKCIFVLRETPSDGYYWNIFLKESNSYVPAKLNLTWSAWTDYTLNSSEISHELCNYVYDRYLDFKNVHFTNTSTTTVCTGVLVKLSDSVFRKAEHTYPNALCTDLFYNKLYDYDPNVQNLDDISVFKPRTIIVSKPTDANYDFDINIVTPECNTIQTSEDIALDVNLDLDNPYSIRDVYNTSSPTVKSILAYVPTVIVNGTPKLTSNELYIPQKTELYKHALTKPVFNNCPFEYQRFEEAYPTPYIELVEDAEFCTYDVSLYGGKGATTEYDPKYLYLEACSDLSLYSRFLCNVLVTWRASKIEYYDSIVITAYTKSNYSISTQLSNVNGSDAHCILGFRVKMPYECFYRDPRPAGVNTDILRTFNAPGNGYKLLNILQACLQRITGSRIPEEFYPQPVGIVKEIVSINSTYLVDEYVNHFVDMGMSVQFGEYDISNRKYNRKVYERLYNLEEAFK